MKKRSAQQQMLKMIKEIVSNLDSQHQTSVLYLDFSKAFDSVNHTIMLRKLRNLGVSGLILAWLKCYQTNRVQTVLMNGTRSSFKPVLSGVPQGSILGPLLLIIYVNDLPDSIESSIPLLFADDTKCLSSSVSCSQVDSSLQCDIHLLFEWNRMTFNEGKTAPLKIPSCHHDAGFSNYKLHADSPDIPVVCSHKDLGLILSSDLSWANHIKHICGKAYRMLGLIRRSVSTKVPAHIKKQLYLTLVRSQLMYCQVLSREIIQRRATTYVLGGHSSDYKTRLISLTSFLLSWRLSYMI